MFEHFGTINFPENLNTQIITGIESAFSNGLTFVAPYSCRYGRHHYRAKGYQPRKEWTSLVPCFL